MKPDSASVVFGAPGPIENSRFTDEEMEKITAGLTGDFKRFAPGWKIADCGGEMDPGLRNQGDGIGQGRIKGIP